MIHSKLKLLIFFAALLSGAAIAAAQTKTNTANPSPASTPAQSTSPAAAPPSASKQTNEGQTEATVPASTTVITINGVCEISPNGTIKSAAHAPSLAKPTSSATPAASKPAAPADCKTQITRADFEKLMKTVAPGAPVTARRQIASRYVQFLTAANEGVKLGVDKDPDFTEQLALMRLQLLAQDAERKLQTQASNVNESDAKTYYDQNPSAFEEATLTRIFVPHTGGDATPAQPAPDAKAIAESARQQLAGGGDAEKIQKSVFEQLKSASEPPSTKFGAKRRGTLPPAHEQKIFALKVGEVTEAIPDSTGFVIYRLDAKQGVPFDQAKDEAKRKITQQRLEDARQQIIGASKADYNDAYFGPESANPAVSPLGGRPPATRPPTPAPGNSAPATGSAQPPQSQPPNPK